MLSSYYDPYRSVPEINKSAYYNYAPQINQQQHQHQHNHSQNGYASQFQQLPNAKWASSYQINTQAAVMPATTTYLERDNNSSGESYYSQTSTVQKPKVISATPTPKKMVANGFPEGSGKTQRIYKTHSDLNKEKSRVKKTILKGDQKKDEVNGNSSAAEKSKKELDISKEIDSLAKKETAQLSGDILNQILKKTQSIETNVLVANHKLMLVENKMELLLSNQYKLMSKVDTVEKEVKTSATSGISPELLREIKDALNIDFDIDLEIKPEEKINKYSINSIKAYKATGNGISE